MSHPKSAVLDVTVPEGVEGRVDVILAERTDLTRTRIQRLIANGAVLVDGKVVNKRFRVSGGENISVDVPPAESVDIIAQDLPLDILYQDGSIVVVNKAAGMVVHPGPGHREGTLVNALLYHLDDLSGVGGRLRPGIVHRLDKDTSGLLVVAKTDAAHHALQAALKVREVRRVYTALSWGHLAEAELTIEAPLGRDRNDRVRMAVVPGGKPSITHVRTVERFLAAELLEVRLETGRTHQIRVHLLHTGHPVAGDSVYGVGWNRGMSGAGQRWARELLALLPRQFLHASELSFDHPETGKSLTFRSELPSDLAASLAWARDNATG